MRLNACDLFADTAARSKTGCAWFVIWTFPFAALAGAPACEVVSGDRLTLVIELYTSEGCSSCPPADQWLST